VLIGRFEREADGSGFTPERLIGIPNESVDPGDLANMAIVDASSCSDTPRPVVE
jgi:hypothetical protein